MKICVVLLTGLGDVVHGLPVVNAIKRQWPDAHITWVVEPGPSGIVRPHPSIDKVIVFRKQQGVAGLRALWREMRRQRFDLTLNLNTFFKSIWPTVFSRAPRRVGFNRPIAADGVWLTANQHLPRRQRHHTQEMFLEFLDLLGIQRNEPQWLIPITEDERNQQEEFFERLRDRRIVGLVGASKIPRKDWPAERYPALVDALVERFDAHVLWLGGPGEREQSVARGIAANARNPVVWGAGDSVRKLIWLTDGCDLVIAPDTGPLHIARALEVPVIGLFGHTNPWRVGPYRKYENLWIDRYTDGPPDPSGYTPKLGRMELITVDDIMQKVSLAFHE
jgi:heptosyltransferase I